MIRAVIFDIDNTLYDFDTVHALAYRTVSEFAHQALDIEPEDFDAIQRRIVKVLREHCGENSAAIHNRLIRFQLMLEEMKRPIALARTMDDMYWSALISRMVPYPGTRAAIEALKTMGLVIGIGTNMTADRQIEKLEKLGLVDIIDYLVSSEEAGAEKPDGRFFALCAKKAGCLARECAFVGDHPDGDMCGALNAGMRAIWYSRKAMPEETIDGTVRLRAFEELPALIASMQTM